MDNFNEKCITGFVKVHNIHVLKICKQNIALSAAALIWNWNTFIMDCTSVCGQQSRVNSAPNLKLVCWSGMLIQNIKCILHGRKDWLLHNIHVLKICKQNIALSAAALQNIMIVVMWTTNQNELLLFYNIYMYVCKVLMVWRGDCGAFFQLYYN